MEKTIERQNHIQQKKRLLINLIRLHIEEIKKDIANKKGIRKEDIDLSKFVHMRTILSIPSHKEIVEQEMGTFLHKKYPKITMDSVKTIFNTMIDLLTRRQQMVRCSVSEKKRC